MPDSLSTYLDEHDYFAKVRNGDCSVFECSNEHDTDDVDVDDTDDVDVDDDSSSDGNLDPATTTTAA